MYCNVKVLFSLCCQASIIASSSFSSFFLDGVNEIRLYSFGFLLGTKVVVGAVWFVLPGLH